MMGLGRTLGRQYAYGLVYDFCRRCVQEDMPLLDLLFEDETVKSQLPKDELVRLCDPANYLEL
jgi:3-carboxy-cis,cis-muconate cycloisomerase